MSASLTKKIAKKVLNVGLKVENPNGLSISILPHLRERFRSPGLSSLQ